MRTRHYRKSLVARPADEDFGNLESGDAGPRMGGHRGRARRPNTAGPRENRHLAMLAAARALPTRARTSPEAPSVQGSSLSQASDARPLRPVPRFPAIVLAGLAALVLGAPAHAQSPMKSIDVRRSSDGFVLDAEFVAPVPARLAFEVLTDFDHFDRFVPNVRSSKVVKREGPRVLIEQQGVARFGLASFPYTSRRQIDMTPPDSIRSLQVEGSMRKVESLMTLRPDGDATRLVYHMEIVPSALSGAVLTTRFLEHEVEETFNAMIAEMVRRRN
jgi:hypothetical protein